MKVKTGTRVRYRLFEKGDIPAILELWKNHSGWGEVSESQFKEWNFNNPYEPNFLVIAEDEDGAIIGQVTFIPSRLWVSNAEIPAVRVVAPILHKDFRLPDLRSFEHPAICMLKSGFREAAQRGYGVGYAFPAQGWLTLSKFMPLISPHMSGTASFGCVKIPLHADNTDTIKANDLKGTRISVFTAEYDALWEEAKNCLPLDCAVVRKRDWLQWKFGNHLVFEFRDRNERLRGYCAIRKNSGLVEDLFATSGEDMAYVLQGTMKMLGDVNTESSPIAFRSLKMMLTGQAEKILSGIYYEPDEYRFAFAFAALQEGIVSNSITTSSWLMFPND